MDSFAIIESAKKQGRNTLTEAEAKEVLKTYGVPVIEEKVVQTIEEAQQAAEKIGYPVVLKGLGARLTHKTERGLVKLGLKNTKDVRDAALYIQKAAGDDLEGFLLQPMLEGKREFVAGLFHDSLFGAIVMFGLGGIFTEALADVVFRVAPVDDKEAGKMIDELGAQKVLSDFRGEQAPHRNALIETLVGLSRIGLESNDIKEIDINPLLVAPSGTVTAVDALIVLGEHKETTTTRVPVKAEAIGNLIYPKSIAFIGASPIFRKWGHTLFTSVIGGKYRGEIYLVNHKGGEIAGRKAYKSILELPGPVDLAVVTVPADQVLSLIPQLKEKNIRNMLLITAGFREIGPEGLDLENKLVTEARKAGILFVGPNTMGICNPHKSLYCSPSISRPAAGNVTLISQSGNLGMQLLAFARQEGIGIRAFIGSGNEAMISIEDYVEGCEVDDVASTIVLYIESIKDGPRFFDVAKRVGKKKPIIALKGGRTQAGSHAAASHTGALASNTKVFDAACRQAGVVLVENTMALLDVSAAFSALPMPKGNRVGIMTGGGGWGVVTVDLCVENGLQIPKLPDSIISKINKLLPPFWSHANPIDLVAVNEPEVHKMIIEELMLWDECDAIIHMGVLGSTDFLKAGLKSVMVADKNYDQKFSDHMLRKMEESERKFTEDIVKFMEEYQKPIIGVSMALGDTSRAITAVGKSKYKSVYFTTPERSVRALAKMCNYARWLNG